MNRLLGCILSLTILSSCSLQKRHYRSGFTIFRSVTGKRAEHEISGVSHAMMRREQTTTSVNIEKVSSTKHLFKDTASAISIALSKRLSSSLRVKIKSKPSIHVRARSLFVNIIPNHVPKAGFRTFIYSLIVFGGALFCFLNYPELVYITAALLIMAFVFTLVSLISSASARNDRINNSKGWLTMSLITLLLDILEIAAIIIFFIALF